MNGFKLPYCHEVDRCKEPTWVKKTIWYQIFVDRFANGNPNRSPKKFAIGILSVRRDI